MQLRRLLLALVVVWLSSTRSAFAAEARLQWTPHEGGVVATWARGSRPADILRDAPTAGVTTLREGELLVMSARAGTQYLVRGEHGQLGLGSGVYELPDVITWTDRLERETLLRVPTWSAARFLVVRNPAKQPTTVSVFRAEAVEDSMAFYRLDRAVYDWLTLSGKPHPAAPDTAHQALLRGLAATKELLAQDIEHASSNDSQRAAARDALRSQLQSQWLAESFRLRPLRRPYFYPATVTLAGGELVPDTALPSERAGRLLRASTQLEVLSEEADVAVLRVQARALGRTIAQVMVGDEVVDEVTVAVSRRGEDGERFTPARLVRVAFSRSKMRVRVTQGDALVSVSGYRALGGLADPPAIRHVAALQRDALEQFPKTAESRLEAIRSWIAYRNDPNATSRAACTSSSGPAALLCALSRFPNDARMQDPEVAFHRLLELLAPLPEAERRALLRPALEAALRATAEPFGRETPFAADSPLEKSAGLTGTASSAQEQRALRTLLAMSFPPADGKRSRLLALSELSAAANAHDDAIVRRAEEAWDRVTPLTRVAPDGEVASRWKFHRVPGVPAHASCPVEGARGLRWTVLGRGSSVFRVRDLGGTHTKIDFFLDREASAFGEVVVDGVPVRIRSHAGSASVSAVTPGPRQFTVRRSAPVFARIPRHGFARCGTLRERTSWSLLTQTTHFELPPGAATPSSIVLDPDSLRKGPRTLKLGVGKEDVTAWFRTPATGAAEVLVPENVTRLTLSPSADVLARVRIRAHRSASTKQRQRPPAARAAPVDLLERLRMLSRSLHAASSDEERDEIRWHRAELLRRLGYDRYARLDLERRSPGATDVDGKPRTAPRGALLLETEAAVVPWGLVAQTPELPKPPDAQALALALRARDRANSEAALALLLNQAEALQTPSEATLLAAELAEALERPSLAVEAVERIAEFTREPRVMRRAALMRTDLAANLGDVRQAERGYRLARRAETLGIDASYILARYGDGVEWVTPSLGGLGIGSESMTLDVEDRTGMAFGTELRSALLDAPPGARFVEREMSIALPDGPGKLGVEATCFAEEGPTEACRYTFDLAGHALDCAETAGVVRCEPVAIPAGARLRVVPDRQPTIGWVRLTRTEHGLVREVPRRAVYTRIDEQHPAELRVSGPAVVRVRARWLAESLSQEPVLRLDVRADGNELSSSPDRSAARVLRLALPAEQDPTARLMAEPQSLVGQGARRYVVVDEGLHTLSARPEHGAALVRLQLAHVTAPPRPRAAASVDPPSTPALDTAQSVRTEPVDWKAVSPVRWPSAPGPLTLGVSLGLVDRDMSEFEVRDHDRYLQSGLGVRRALVEDRSWLHASVFHRGRAGANSAGAALSASWSAYGAWPGASVHTQWVRQEFDSGAAWGQRTMLSAYERLQLDEGTSVNPSLGMVLRRADPAAQGRTDADRDVRSPYTATHPTSYDVAVSVYDRPRVDALLRHKVRLRLNPGFSGVDRTDLSTKLTTVAGSGLTPWFTVTGLASHRPANGLREVGFLRLAANPSVELWKWIDADQRWRAGVDGSFVLDLDEAGGPSTRVYGRLYLAYDYVFGRGLTDFSFAERPHRGRLEEGARVSSGESGDDSAWEDVQ